MSEHTYLSSSFVIEMDRMSCRLAAKAAQEESGKHTYAMCVAIEVMRQRVKSYRQDMQTVQTMRKSGSLIPASQQG